MGTFKTKYTNSMGGHPKAGVYNKPPGGQTAKEILEEASKRKLLEEIDAIHKRTNLIEIDINGKTYRGTLEQVIEFITKEYTQ